MQKGDGWDIGRDQVARLMNAGGISTIRRERPPPRRPAKGPDTRPHLVNATFILMRPIAHGSLTLRMCVRDTGSSTRSLFPTSFSRKIVGWSTKIRPSQPRKCLSMPSTGLSRYPKDACQASYTAAIMAPSTCPSTTRTPSRTTQSPDQLRGWGIPTTADSPKQSTACTRPNSSTPKAHRPASTTPNSPPPN